MKRVLLVRLSAMGDLVQTLGAISSLHESRPDLELHLLTQQSLLPLVAGLPGLTSAVGHERHGGPRGWLRTRKRLRSLGCETALDLQGNWKSAACTWLSGARERLGAAGAWRQEPWSRVWLSRTVAVPGPRHPALVALALVRELAPAATARPPRLGASDAEVAAAAAVVQSLGIDPRAPFRVVVVGAAADPRSQRPAALRAEAVAGGPGPTLLLLGPDEEGIELPARTPRWLQRRGQLRELVGLGALVALVGGEVVGPDRGAMHVLAATGARTTVLFGPQDPLRTAPVGARVLVHREPPKCAPCGERRCRHPQGPVCMAFTSAQGREAPGPRA